MSAAVLRTKKLGDTETRTIFSPKTHKIGDGNIKNISDSVNYNPGVSFVVKHCKQTSRPSNVKVFEPVDYWKHTNMNMPIHSNMAKSKYLTTPQTPTPHQQKTTSTMIKEKENRPNDNASVYSH